MKESITTSWAIHTTVGPIRRVFSTIEIAKQWAITEWSGAVIEPGYVDEAPVSFSIRYEGTHDEVFATICQQQHCACCGRVIATRSDINGEWRPAPNGHDYWSKDLEIEP